MLLQDRIHAYSIICLVVSCKKEPVGFRSAANTLQFVMFLGRKGNVAFDDETRILKIVQRNITSAYIIATLPAWSLKLYSFHRNTLLFPQNLFFVFSRAGSCVLAHFLGAQVPTFFNVQVGALCS